jgi:hypothetical protein
VCGVVGATFQRQRLRHLPPQALAHDEVFATGRFRYRQTPQVPHCWDAGLPFEETQRVLPRPGSGGAVSVAKA